MSIPELKIAEQLFSKKRLETGAVRRETTILQGTALSDSEDGYVAVDYPGNVTVGETAEIRIPTGPAVKAGDSVEISLTGGTGKSPMVSNVPGWGDRQQQQINRSLTAYTDDSTYYLLSATVPATPTDSTWEAAGWSTTEPVWSEDDNRTLYMSRRIELVDGTVTWSAPAEVTANASLEVAKNAILASVSETYTTKTEFADSADTASGSGRSVATTDAAGLALRNLTVYGESVQDGTPTPDAPVEIRTVSGVNLLPLTEASVNVNGVHATVKSDGTIELSGTATAKVTLTLNGRNGGDPYGPILPKENYYYTICEGTTADIWFSVQLKNLSTGANVYTDNKGTDVSVYRNVDTQLRWVYLQVTSGTNCDGVVLKPAIYKNGKRPWLPYGNLLATAGKNLIRVQDSTATFTNTYYAQFTATDTARSATLFELEAGTTYTFSMDVESSVEPFNISIGCGNGTYARDIASKENNSNGRISITFTPSAAQLAYGKYLAFRAPRYGTSTTFTYSVSNVQLEIGSTATEYEPYRESTSFIDLKSNVLASLPDGTRDVLHVESGRAWFEKHVAALTFDGSENWRYYSYSGRNGFYLSHAADGIPNSSTRSSNTQLLSNQLAKGTGNAGADNSAYLSGTASSTELNCIVSQFANTAAWKAHIASTPLTIYYPLATPTTIDLGEVSLPTVTTGDTVRIIAEVTPEFDTSWWRDTDIVGRTTDVQSEAATAARNAQNTANTANTKVNDLSSRMLTVEAKADGLGISVGEMQQKYDGTITNVNEYFKFKSEGLEISKSDSPMKMTLSEEDLIFTANGQEVMKLDAVTSTVDADRFQIGVYRWQEMGNAIALVYVGGGN